KHPVNPRGAPSYVVTASSRGAQGACALVLREPDPNRPPASPDKPHRSVAGARDQSLLEWARPATTLAGDARLQPPGHHDEYSQRSVPDAVVLSERAAKIIQGLPEDWVLAGRTKKS